MKNLSIVFSIAAFLLFAAYGVFDLKQIKSISRPDVVESNDVCKSLPHEIFEYEYDLHVRLRCDGQHFLRAEPGFIENIG